jgi:hypothetical protein
MPLPERWQGDWQGKFFDLGHVPLFAALTVCLWWFLRRFLLWSAVISLAVAALAEMIQDQFGRTGSLSDFVRGALGVLAAVVALRAWQGPRTVRRLGSHALVIVGLVAWPVAEAAPWLLDAYDGYRSFPTLADFSTARQLLRWDCQQAALTREPDVNQPSGWSARLEFRPGPEKYPAAILQPIVRDWSQHSQLCCSFTVVEEPLLLVISIRGGRDASGQSNHYQFEETYAVGAHRVCVDLATIARKAGPHPLDLSDIRYFQMFIYRTDRSRNVVLHRVWLE